MAIVKCHECGADVSTEAKACPKCGAKVKRPASRTKKLLYSLVAVVVVAGVVAQQQNPEKRAAEAAARDGQVAQLQAGRAAMNALKSSLRDPDSMKLDAVRVSDDRQIVCIEYRARNGFGGVNRSMAVFVDRKQQATDAAWNKHCLKPMLDYATQLS